MVQGAGLHLHQRLVLAQGGLGDVLEAEDFGPAELVIADGFHESLI
jgi:hypothetical protein